MGVGGLPVGWVGGVGAVNSMYRKISNSEKSLHTRKLLPSKIGRATQNLNP